MGKRSTALIGLMLALGGSLAAWQLIWAYPVRFGALADTSGSRTLLFAYGYVTTLAGVILGSAYRNLQWRKARGEESIPSIGEFARSVVLSIDFWMALCGSPIVYALLLRATDGGGIASLTTIALENGFCCTMVVSGITAKHEKH